MVNENCLAVSVFCIQFINGLFLLSTLEYSMVSSHKYVLEPTTPLGNHAEQAKDDRYSAPHFNNPITSANHEFALLFWKTINHPADVSKQKK